MVKINGKPVKEKYYHHASQGEAINYTSTEKVRKDIFKEEIPRLQAFLEVVGLGKRERIWLEGEKILIGRAPECDIQLPVKNISRKHACVRLKNEEYLIEDLDSTNGIYINGVKIAKCTLRHRDQIEIGEMRMTFIEY